MIFLIKIIINDSVHSKVSIKLIKISITFILNPIEELYKDLKIWVKGISQKFLFFFPAINIRYGHQL
jgi:hypothetical protein